MRQSGIPDLVFSDIVRDARVLAKAREIAGLLMDKDPELSQPGHADLARWIASRDAVAQPAE